jgi:hypothetical protein
MCAASICTFVAVFGIALPAAATPSFPKGVQKQLSLESSPPCTICHATALGGKGTVTQEFGLAMRQRGLVAYDDVGLKAVLDKMGSDHVDSDRDGTPDTQALKEGKNPNDGTVIDPNVASPEAGDAGPTASGLSAAEPDASPEPAASGKTDDAAPSPEVGGCSLSLPSRDWPFSPLFAALGMAALAVRRKARGDGRVSAPDPRG